MRADPARQSTQGAREATGRRPSLTPQGVQFLFEFKLGQGGAANAGEALASGTAAFVDTSVSTGGEAQTPGAVPEPGTLSLLAVGLWPLAVRSKRRPS
jgi:hypothetical protein